MVANASAPSSKRLNSEDELKDVLAAVLTSAVRDIWDIVLRMQAPSRPISNMSPSVVCSNRAVASGSFHISLNCLYVMMNSAQ